MPLKKHGGESAVVAGLDVLRKSEPEIYEMLSRQEPLLRGFEAYHAGILDELGVMDPVVYQLIEKEYQRLNSTIQLIAAENQCSRAVLGALGSIVQNKTTEGFPGMRFHGGCEIVDCLEELAAERAAKAFGARYVNVQPHSGTQANQIVMTAFLENGDRILSLAMDQGGHVSHGVAVSFSGKFFETENYCVNPQTHLLDYEEIRRQARAFKPKMIICGASAYSRTIDFAKFRLIADEVGAYLLADISHLASLIMAGEHPSPVNQAHFTTTSTYKPGGPRGGIIVLGEDFNESVEVEGVKRALWKHIDKATFPGVQGTPNLNNIAAKAVFFREVLSEEYQNRQKRIILNAKRLASKLLEKGYEVLTGGTDNHMVMVNIANYRPGLTGVIAQRCLEECGIIVNMNKLPYDTRPPAITSGMRLGTPIVTKNGMGTAEMDLICDLIDEVICDVGIVSEKEYRLDSRKRSDMKLRTAQLGSRFRCC